MLQGVEAAGDEILIFTEAMKLNGLVFFDKAQADSAQWLLPLKKHTTDRTKIFAELCDTKFDTSVNHTTSGLKIRYRKLTF